MIALVNIVEDFRDDKKQFKVAISNFICAKFVMGYTCVRHFVLYSLSRYFALFLSYVNITNYSNSIWPFSGHFEIVCSQRLMG